MANPNQWYGWRPDKPDKRDLTYRAQRRFLRKLVRKVDLRLGMPVVYDQGQLGSCTANAIAAAFQFEKKRQKQRSIMPSRLFIYYNERVMEGSVGEDAGAEIRDGIKSVANEGICSEAAWPYVISKFTRKPPKSCYTSGLLHQALLYRRISENLTDMKSCLAEGLPFVFGFTVYDSFESDHVARTGMVPMPGQGESVLGGHAVLACGYDDNTNRFLVRNSWGGDWGLGGYCWMPYAYLSDPDLADDRWVISSVE
jgi:C1A family cysteine protease